MKLKLDATTGALYLQFAPGRVADTVELADLIVADIDNAGAILGIEFVHGEDFGSFLRDHPDVAPLPSRLSYTSLDRAKEWHVETGVGEDLPVDKRTAINAHLNGRFLSEVLAQPSLLDRIPPDATLILLPHDDPELGILNLGLASKRAVAGENVRLQRVGVPTPEAFPWHETEILERNVIDLQPRWPAVPPSEVDHSLDVGYDPDRDALLIDFFGDRRPANAVLSINPYIWLLVDIEEEEVIGLIVPHFRDLVLKRAPLVGELLLLSFAEVEGLSRAEAHRVRDKMGRATWGQPFAAIADELARLIA